MTPKQRRFAEEYLIDLNAKQAAIRAGYAEKGAKEQGCVLLTYPNVAIYVTEKIKERSELAMINAAWVLKRAAMLADFNIENFIVLNEQGDACYDFSMATKNDWYCIAEYTVKTVRGRTGLIPVKEVKLKSYCKLRALELVGKHVSVQAFKDRVEHSGAVEVHKVTRTYVSPKSKPEHSNG